LTNREKLLTKLDEFNEIQTDSDSHASSTKEQVFYSEENDNWMIKDVGEMVSLVSMILIIFAVVSLTVSCAMTALLTSNNVLERKTEIGLLRSLGARKSDVAMIFETEAFYICAFSGLLGSLLTYCLSFPINALINSYYSYYKVGVICDFTWWHLLIVLGISIVVGLLSALIPAIKAARENPVDCIRSQ
jgi:putative ABC transport system permease protein